MSQENPGAAAPAAYPRIGTLGATYLGLPREGWRDAYHLLLTMPTAALLGVMALAYLTVNSLFATLYLVDPGGVINARPGSVADACFFSAQTLGGLGYGVMSPKSLYANCVTTAETFVGLFN